MSFGTSVGDILTVGQMAWRLYQRCRSAPKGFTDLTIQVSALSVVLNEVGEIRQDAQFAKFEAKLELICTNCEGVLVELQAMLDRFESLGSNKVKVLDRFRYDQKETEAMQRRLADQVGLLLGFHTLVSSSTSAADQSKIGNRLDCGVDEIKAGLELILAEIKAGQRNNSILSSASSSSIEGEGDVEPDVNGMCDALEELGLDSATVKTHRQFVASWLGELSERSHSLGDLGSRIPYYDAASNMSLARLEVNTRKGHAVRSEVGFGTGIDLLDIVGYTSEFSEDAYPPSIRRAATNLGIRSEVESLCRRDRPLFIGGPLIFPEVLRSTVSDPSLTKTISRMIPALLIAKARQRNETPYPMKGRFSFIEGFLAFGLTREQKNSIAKFQGDLYDMVPVQAGARLQGHQLCMVSAEMFAWIGNEDEECIVGSWDAKQFMRSPAYQCYV
ncbi:hypothetical protein NM208_g11009 [Fusarium decemcellulare]|uniref:Uncharacterized protein n=1 Tax=Fusarium decemcellulare TaxID=57161 RepID=A0ACC1RVV6_9HYPO|nr:hypothetical protein NM208_g11009 [Fusarium decemcellulare]